ncbi:MAG: FtsX-like permease family protein [Ardenticatenaceae bacterium]|nr:FtsX-like permease family protein [Ardenticatenaceae bacterium]
MMLRIRWRKVLLDLWRHKARTILVTLAIAVGVFAIGFIASAQAILLRELQADYENALVASAILYTDPFDDALVETVLAMPEIETAEGRRGLAARIQTPDGEWRNLLLTTIADYDDISLDRIIPVAGNWPPDRQEMVVERLSLPYLEAELGDEVRIEFPGGLIKTIKISGVAFDNQVPSADITGRAFAYIDFDTLEKLGQGAFYTELRFRVAENTVSLSHIQDVTEAVRQKVERSGREVYAVNTPPPGEHWAEDIIATLILLFFIFGGIILFLAGFLVINTVTALLTQQMQQIGIMKLVGARRLQIMSMYIIMVVLYGLVALFIGIPAGIQMGRAAVAIATDLLNVTVNNEAVPLGVILIQVAVGLLIPLGAALWPVLTSVKITTHKALSSTGLDEQLVKKDRFQGLLNKVQHYLALQRPMILSIRNAVRRKGRMLLTLLILVMGTALFVSVLTVRDSVAGTLDNFLRYHNYDVGLRLNRTYRAAQLLDTASRIDEVEAAETWLTFGTRRLRPDGSESGGFQLVGLPAATDFIDPDPQLGRWLVPEDTQALVANTFFMAEEEGVSIGDTVLLKVNGRELEFTLVGVVPAPADGSTKLYVNYEYLTYTTRTVGQANAIQLKIAGDQRQQEAALLEFFSEEGYQVVNTSTADGVRDEFYLRFNIVILFLVVMAILLAVVGGLGLTTTMSINVLERIREIGVLRAIGASNSAVRKIVLTEGLAIGLASWVIGVLVSLPLSVVLSNQVGLALLQMPLDYHYSIVGALLWLGALLVLAVLASLGPAQNASRLTIREVLAYD